MGKGFGPVLSSPHPVAYKADGWKSTVLTTPVPVKATSRAHMDTSRPDRRTVRPPFRVNFKFSTYAPAHESLVKCGHGYDDGIG
jgi:hypothetical protein